MRVTLVRPCEEAEPELNDLGFSEESTGGSRRFQL